MNISIIVAISENGVIGRNNKLAWNLPDDMFYFSKMTLGHSIIMGRKNWDSIPNKWRPLPNRKNIIISRNINHNIKNVDITNSIEKAIKIGRENEDEEIFIIGGGEIYKLGFKFVDKLYITEIKNNIEGDTFFPKWNKREWKEISRISHPSDLKHIYDFDYVIYKKK
ncbi:MAG: dihydrofolate reductase [Marinoscillum sp.]|jgi:dihydrofolate reductase